LIFAGFALVLNLGFVGYALKLYRTLSQKVAMRVFKKKIKKRR
jgi:heme O synthase-like polyprenyltransferase